MNENEERLRNIRHDLKFVRTYTNYKPVIDKEPDIRKGLDIAIDACNKRLEALGSDNEQAPPTER